MTGQELSVGDRLAKGDFTKMVHINKSEGDNMELRSYKYLWETNEYFLEKMSEGYLIIHKKNNTVLLIEDDGLYDKIIEQMFKAKCEIRD
ncbi:hypothetical protein PTI45_00291 [Paenibacillus nuruki]|uniref:Uncharacterized protein n=1 Tax=Paenibacillus nuruki TaxID=1886670 RepID=A0A1E3LBI2_9BACL|nr:hypothetical protein [Paenibacillus nuruki]ODP28569.1 hypothetical protein PTI45_02114 [Paenibacillus nuruki]ODP30290.1 hypothetical protein PTI45_00291 [Paenibacillus nuruki]